MRKEEGYNVQILMILGLGLWTRMHLCVCMCVRLYVCVCVRAHVCGQVPEGGIQQPGFNHWDPSP